MSKYTTLASPKSAAVLRANTCAALGATGYLMWVGSKTASDLNLWVRREKHGSFIIQHKESKLMLNKPQARKLAIILGAMFTDIYGCRRTRKKIK